MDFCQRERSSAELGKMLLFKIDESAVSSQQTVHVAEERIGFHLNEDNESSALIFTMSL